ncbi:MULTISPECIES: lipid kinase [Actinopolyspora]|uniref:Lipid kinase, YegS/Rv2252/BmrU family n=1 Tax=Actinopolyspora saharensis TaxID=995062 RepID=A0A1H1G836_9ACTN|nr:lipid kinase [Actinopolyspora saharensis]NHD16417.1 lipid kinase [Actinopolyspora sp. BKK2]NHE75720.1 lipid kinase [Actinopolyspora sp. BKK1]SDR09361.1 lipid kinase, YegS/Rv2252/BmrU family [Actinopolyspora saharensis]
MSTNGETVNRVAVVVNTLSRTGSIAYSQAIRSLTAQGVPLGTTYPLRDPARLVETVRSAVDDGHDFVVIGGGDGTISSVVDVLAHTGVPMGLLPLGTANDFARTLEIPTDLEQACRTIAHGKVVDIDLGLCGNNYYANRASIGIGSNVATAMSPALKKRIGSLAYPIASLKGFVRHRPFPARLSFPDGDHEPREYNSLLQVSVANGRYFGGGQLAVPDSGIDDSTLDITVIRHGNVRELLTVARKFKSTELLETDQAEHIRTRRVRIETKPDMPINIDGELVASTPQEVSVARNALHVAVPQSWVDGG